MKQVDTAETNNAGNWIFENNNLPSPISNLQSPKILRGGIWLFLCLFLGQKLSAQYNCNTLYGIRGTDGVSGSLVSINTTTGAGTFLRAMPTGAACNLALGPDPTNNMATTMWAANCPAGSRFWRSTGGAFAQSAVSISPAKISGICVRPSDGWIFGMSDNKTLYRWNGTGSFAPAGSVTGDATWNAGIPAADMAAMTNGNLFCFLVNGAVVYLYQIDPTTLKATRYLQTTLPVSTISGISAYTVIGSAFLNDNLYVSQGRSNNTCTFYRVNVTTGVATQFASGQPWTVDFATCAVAPTPVEICGDNIDNDGDGLADCADTDCSSTPACSAGAMCTGQVGMPVINVTFGTGGRTTLATAAAGATTTYNYQTSGTVVDGNYAVDNSASWWGASGFDHSGSGATGRSLIVNASYAAGEFFRMPVSGLCGGTKFQFTAWIKSISNDAIKPNVTFEIRNAATNAVIASKSSGNITSFNTWVQHGFTFSTTISNLILVLKNNAPGGAGNDLIIDDIQFAHCGPVTTITAVPKTEVCDGSSVTLKGAVTSGFYNTPQYQWQISSDGGTTWANLTGATSINYTFIANASATNKRYRLLVAENGSITSAACRVFSNNLLITLATTGCGEICNDAGTLDEDSDGLANCLDPDCWANATACPDADSDGVPNAVDLDDDNDGISDTVETTTDTDGDGIPNNLDLDSDNDGISDLVESGHNPIVLASLDADKDGVIDPNQAFGTNGLVNSLETNDTGTAALNYTLLNSDGTDNPNYLDLDSNNDGIFDIKTTSWGYLDGNNDGKIDGATIANDADGDGLKDGAPLDSKNTHGGSYGSLSAVVNNTSGGWTDLDDDGVVDYLDCDIDNDGITNITEGIVNTDGDNVPNLRDLDSDGDGLVDLSESGISLANLNLLDGDFNGVIDKSVAVGANGYANSLESAENCTANYTLRNSDGTDNPDYLDLDSDNDAVTDAKEAGLLDTDNNGKIDGVDTDSDGIINIPSSDPNSIFGGTRIAHEICGNGIDDDGDGDLDCDDADCETSLQVPVKGN
jgi:hypothetical protein